MADFDSSDSDHSDIRLQKSSGSSEGSDMEAKNSKQDRDNKELSRKRKRKCINQALSDSSTEDEDASLAAIALKKKQKRSPKNLPVHNEQQETSAAEINDEIMERSQTPVKEKSDGNNSVASFSSPDTRKTSAEKEVESDGSESGKTTEENTQEEEKDVSDSSVSENIVAEEQCTEEKEHSEKTTQSSSSRKSDVDLENDEESKLVSQEKSDGSDSSESFSSIDMCTPAQKGKLKSDTKKKEKIIKKDSEGMTKNDRGIERLKRYLRVAGIRVRSYEKLWEGCKTKKAKTQKLLQMLNDAGLKGKPTVEKCKRLQAKRERKEEVASLDVGNIITSDKGRPKRNAYSLYLNSHATVEEKPQEQKISTVFSRIKNLVDSEESD